MKKCSCCRQSLGMKNFNKETSNRDGLGRWCKSCSKQYREDNKGKLFDQWKKYYRKNKDKIRQYHRENKDKICAWQKQWHKENKDKINNYVKNRCLTDIQYKLSKLLRGRLARAIRGNYKSGSAVRDLGCSIPELKIYLEKQFLDGMNWKNQGEWHIDHKTPLHSFDLTDRNQLLKAVHYLNLQPLWAHDNVVKNDKILDVSYCP